MRGISRPDLKEQILKLRKTGKTYYQIKDELKCSISIVAYHCNSTTRVKQENTRNEKRKLWAKKHPYAQKTANFQAAKGIRGHQIYTPVKNRDFTHHDVRQKFGETPFCYVCGIPIDIHTWQSYCFDHIIPRTRGGDCTLNNLGLCCKDCNVAKSNLSLDELLTLCRRIVAFHS